MNLIAHLYMITNIGHFYEGGVYLSIFLFFIFHFKYIQLSNSLVLVQSYFQVCLYRKFKKKPVMNIFIFKIPIVEILSQSDLINGFYFYLTIDQSNSINRFHFSLRYLSQRLLKFKSFADTANTTMKDVMKYFILVILGSNIVMTTYALTSNQFIALSSLITGSAFAASLCKYVNKRLFSFLFSFWKLEQTYPIKGKSKQIKPFSPILILFKG